MDLLTVSEACDQLKVNERTLRRWIRGGTLPAAKVGRAWRIKREDLEAFAAARPRQHRAPAAPPASPLEAILPDLRAAVAQIVRGMEMLEESIRAAK